MAELWHTLSIEKVFEKLQTSEHGLNEEEAEIRLKEYGFNKIKEISKIKAWKIFLEQFNSFLIYILLAAALVSAFISHWLDFSLILAVVILNAFFGFIQQYRAERAIQNLKQMLIPTARVMRQGKVKEIDAELLVPGDVIILNEGDRVMADARLFYAGDAQTNEAVLTGESMPVEKLIHEIRDSISIADRINMVFLGTTIERGNAKAIVTATSMATEFGKIAVMLQQPKKELTPLQKKLNLFSKQLGITTIIIMLALLFIGIVVGIGKFEMFLTSVSLAVAAIPEGLPAVITLCLAFAVKRMLKVKALIRKLPAAETLGRVTVICLPGNTPIICNPSIKPISSVSEGDKVLGLDGNFHTVIKTFRREHSGKMTHIKAMGLPLIKITPEHPILIAKIKRHRPLLNLNGVKSRPRKVEIMKPEWILAGEVKRGDFVAIPRIKEEKPYSFKFRRGREGKEIELSLDEELAELFGWYLAEGCCGINKGSYYIIFYLGKNEKENVERVKYLIEKKLGLKAYTYQKRTSTSIVAINKDLVNFLRENFGKKAESKKLPEFILSASESVIKKFLESYLKGDGNVDNYYIRFVTASKTLAYQLIILIAKLGIRCRLHIRKGYNGIIENRKVNVHESYELFINGSQADLIHPVKNNLKELKRNLSLFDKDFVYVPVRDVKESYEFLDVFNIETESNTYAIPFIVHNCSDKTGTITKEELKIVKILCNSKLANIDNRFLSYLENTAEARMLLKIGCMANNARLEVSKHEDGTEKEYFIGDATEKALLRTAKQFGFNKESLTHAEPRVKEFAFTSERKMMSIIRRGKDARIISYVKGSPEVILQRCNREIINGRVVSMDVERKKHFLREYAIMASEALRVIAFAYKFLPPYKENVSEQEAEYGLIFVGFQGIFDVPREEVKEAIEKCEKAGIAVKMITGDSLVTARAVAKQIGLKGEAIEGRELKKMKDDELLERMDKIAIFARVDPADKVRVISILKQKNEIVATTGDGVNDAPALKKADIGIAMGIRGSDVTRDVADIVLLDDHFATIVKAVEEGRRVYDNIKKFTYYLLSTNLAEIFIVFFALLIGIKLGWQILLPLLPLQILWINLVSDSIIAVTISRSPAEKNVMHRKPEKINILTWKVLFLLVGIAAFITIITLLLFAGYANEPLKAQTIAFTTLVLFEGFNAFNFSSFSQPLHKRQKNYLLVVAVAFTFLLQLGLIYTPFMQEAFHTTALTIQELIWIGIASVSILVVGEIFKILKTFGKQT